VAGWGCGAHLECLPLRCIACGHPRLLSTGWQSADTTLAVLLLLPAWTGWPQGRLRATRWPPTCSTACSAPGCALTRHWRPAAPAPPQPPPPCLLPRRPSRPQRRPQKQSLRLLQLAARRLPPALLPRVAAGAGATAWLKCLARRETRQSKRRRARSRRLPTQLRLRRPQRAAQARTRLRLLPRSSRRRRTRQRPARRQRRQLLRTTAQMTAGMRERMRSR
jgi:hypothetical protein